MYFLTGGNLAGRNSDFHPELFLDPHTVHSRIYDRRAAPDAIFDR